MKRNRRLIIVNVPKTPAKKRYQRISPAYHAQQITPIDLISLTHGAYAINYN
jgi:hypothetical protein